jgi:1-acyl-sn-glycerol-3-phosphate acyltransferase
MNDAVAAAGGLRTAIGRGRHPQTSYVVRGWRLIRFACHLLYGAGLAGLYFPFATPRGVAGTIGLWCRQALAMLAIELHVEGRTAPGPLLLLANHVSWIDILVLNAVTPARFVAKSDILRWPFTGWFATRAGTVFLQRKRLRDLLRVNVEIAGILKEGGTVAIFPEGTTSDGSTVLKFHPALIQPAIAARAAIQPVALRFQQADGALCTAAAYVGDRSFRDTLSAVLAIASIEVRVVLMAPLETAVETAVATTGRRALACAARGAIRDSLHDSGRRFPGNSFHCR